MKLRLSLLAKFNSFVLFLVAAVLAASTWWGLKELRKPYGELDQLIQVSDLFSTQVKDPINLYLESGDALLLSEAEQGLARTLENITILPVSEQQSIKPLIEELKVFLAGDFRAAGKLAGDPQGLLLQNERESRDELALLVSYALEGQNNDISSANRFIRIATSLLEMVHNRAIVREKFFQSFDPNDMKTIARINQQALKDAELLRDIPLLGVFEEEEEDFGLSLSNDDEEKEDKGIERIDTVNYLIKRYVDEIGRTQQNIERVSQSRGHLLELVEKVDAVIEQGKKAISEKVDQAFSTVQSILMGVVIVIIVFAVLIDFIQRSIVRRISDIVPYLADYASGDFRREVGVNALTEEVQSLADSSNQLRNFMSELVSDVQDRSTAVDSISHELAALSKDVSRQSQEQLGETSKISVSVEQMNESFNDVAQSAAGAADAAQQASDAVNDGNTLVQNSVMNVRNLVADVRRTSESVKELSSEAENIDSVLTVIETIAEQTNLLALNAAIEAARAGDQGRGFAVVADEVRSLSVRTSESTKEIKEIIDRLQSSARNTVDVMENHSEVAQQAADQTEVAGARLDEIVHSISHIKELNSQIAVTTEEQAAVAGDINLNIAHIKELSEQTSLSANATEEKSDDLNAVCAALKQSSERFKV